MRSRLLLEAASPESGPAAGGGAESAAVPSSRHPSATAASGGMHCSSSSGEGDATETGAASARDLGRPTEFDGLTYVCASTQGFSRHNCMRVPILGGNVVEYKLSLLRS